MRASGVGLVRAGGSDIWIGTRSLALRSTWCSASVKKEYDNVLHSPNLFEVERCWGGGE